MVLDKLGICGYNHVVLATVSFGCIAQLARASGSYPAGRRFESHYSHVRPLGQEVKTSPFHGGDTSSILVGVTFNPNPI